MLQKRLAQLIIFCLILTATFSTASAQLFTDVKETSSHYKHMEYLVNAGIIDADAEQAFRAGESITRYEAAELLARALKLDTELRPIPTYTDVAEDDPRMPIIAAVTELQIMTGSDGTFKPDASLTRAQAAGILTRAFSLQGAASSSFPDVAATHWAASAISALIANQITTGFEDGTFRPNGTLTRSNFAVFVARVLEPSFRVPKNEVPAPNPAPAPVPAQSCEKETTKTTYKVDVAVANLWKHYNNARSVDRLSTTNPVDYDKKYKGEFPKFLPKMDSELKKYLKLIDGKEVLDLGIGQGQNSISLANLGFTVTGVDYSNNCLDICKSNCPELNLVQSDVRSFKIEKDKYDLILSRCVLHFLHKDDAYEIMKEMKDNLKENGLIYLYIFSTEDPLFKKYSSCENFEVIENNIFHNKVNDTYISFYTKEEVLNIFSDLKTVYISQEYSLDLGHGEPHYHGVIKYIGKKEN